MNLAMGSAVNVPFTPNTRYPDPAVEVLDPRFMGLRLFSSSVEQLLTGLRWGEGPVWFGDGRYLLLSDIPNNRIIRWDETSGAASVFRQPSNHANGLARDTVGRLITCEHGGRRITRTEYDGAITVLADRFEGKRLNSPNDIICQSNGVIWFTDPTFGISGWWEGAYAEPELPHAVYRLETDSGKLTRVIEDMAGPNGLAFSPDEKVLFVVESRAEPHRLLWAYDVSPDGSLHNKRLHINPDGYGALDGIAVDVQGNIWAGFGSSGQPDADLTDLDGVRVFSPDGQPIGHIHLPERCANLCFGGRHRNRLFMASSHSLYSLFVNVQGAP